MFPLSSSSALPQSDSARGSDRAGSRALFIRVLLVLLFALCINQLSAAQSSNPLGALLGKNQASQSAPAPATTASPAAPPSPVAIPLPEVSTRAEELARLLRDTSDQLPTREQLDALKATLAERDATLQAKKKEVDTLLTGSPSAMEVREQETYWHALLHRGRRHPAATAGLGQCRSSRRCSNCRPCNRNGR